jgi:HK97 gp10 family phage protein
MTVEIVVVGADALIYKFKGIEVAVQTEIINDVLDAAAEECRQIASDNAPVGEGTHGEHLADSIEVTGKGNSRQIGPNKGAYWGEFVERGTGERETKGNWVHSTGSMPKQPFLAPAVEDPRVQEKAQEVFREWIAKI